MRRDGWENTSDLGKASSVFLKFRNISRALAERTGANVFARRPDPADCMETSGEFRSWSQGWRRCHVLRQASSTLFRLQLLSAKPGETILECINLRRCPLRPGIDRLCATAANVAMGQQKTIVDCFPAFKSGPAFRHQHQAFVRERDEHYEAQQSK
jgi:hypothetical protein